MPTSPSSHHELVPQGFQTHVANIGIKDSTEDFVCILSTVPCQTAGVLTQNAFAGPSVHLSRKHLANGQARAIVAISKNANVANGSQGDEDAQQVVAGVAAALHIPAQDILLASTGVIGRPYPMQRILPHLQTLDRAMKPADFQAAARGIMTTDTVAKIVSIRIGQAVLTGIAKGVGMIEPNMATLLVFFATDAAVPAQQLGPLFRRVMDRSFNCLSIDTDTSTSDSAFILANGLAGPVDLQEFEQALDDVSLQLVQTIARDGEGATKLLEVCVDQAMDSVQAKQIAKAVVNSPLVKTAVHGADPNWGRVAMAIGKSAPSATVDPNRTIIRFAELEVYPNQPDPEQLLQLEALLQQEAIRIHISLGLGTGQATVWGCDLSTEYVHINAEYTT